MRSIFGGSTKKEYYSAYWKYVSIMKYQYFLFQSHLLIQFLSPQIALEMFCFKQTVLAEIIKVIFHQRRSRTALFSVKALQKWYIEHKTIDFKKESPVSREKVVTFLTEEFKPTKRIKPEILKCESHAVVWTGQFRTWYEN